MKVIWTLAVMLLCANAAGAQADPTQGNDGTASYGYGFDLPPARGRFQPQLGLSYNSAQGGAVDGVGWSLNMSFIEPNTRASLLPSGLPRSTGYLGTTEWWLTLNGATRILVIDPASSSSPAADFRPDIDSGYTKVHRNSDQSWTMTDGIGNQYQFKLIAGSAGTRYYLQTVTDVDGNAAKYTYTMETSQDASASSALLSEIQYSNIGANWIYQISLGYIANANPQVEVIDNALTEHDKSLSTVTVQRLIDGTSSYSTLKSYTITYQQSTQTGRQLLTGIQQFGISGSGADGGIPIDQGFTFSYSGQTDGGSSPPWFTLSAQAAAAVFPSAQPLSQSQCDNIYQFTSNVDTQCSTNDVAAYLDMNGDGLPDMVWSTTIGPDAGVWWAKNISKPGQIAFGSMQQVTDAADGGWQGLISFADPSGLAKTQLDGGQTQLIDLNGDGRPDLLESSSPNCPDTESIAIRYNRGDSSGNESFSAPVCTNICGTTGGLCLAINEWMLATGNTGVSGNRPITAITLTGSTTQLLDVTGDGIPDFVLSVPGPAWIFFQGYLDNNGAWQILQTEQTLQVPANLTAANGATNAIALNGTAKVGTQNVSDLLVDINGDGYPDFAYSAVTSSGSNVSLNWNVSYASPGSGISFGFEVPSQFNAGEWVIPGPSCPPPVQGAPIIQGLSPSAICELEIGPGWFTAAKNAIIHPATNGIMLDVNGDGKPDYVYSTASAYYGDELYYLANLGDRFASPVDLGRFGLPFAAGDKPTGCNDTCISSSNQTLIDIDGDGIMDYITVGLGATPSVQLGATSDHTPKADLLLNVVTPMMAHSQITYWASTYYGVASGFAPHPVVTSMKTTIPISNGGPTASTRLRESEFWYGFPAAAASWDDPARIEQLGFGTTTALDDASGVIVRRVWGGGHLTDGIITQSITGVNPGYLPGSNILTYLTVAETDSDLEGCAVVASQVYSYPVFLKMLGAVNRRMEGAATLESDMYGTLAAGASPSTATVLSINSGPPVHVTCDSVDGAGNIVSATYVKDTNDPGSAIVLHSSYAPVSSSQAICKSCILESYATTTSSTADLFRAIYHYDAPYNSFGPAPNNVTSGHLNYVDELVSGSGDTGQFETTSYQSYDAFGMLSASRRDYIAGGTSASVVSAYTYDTYTHQRIIGTQTTDVDRLGNPLSGYSICTTISTDLATGSTLSASGPFVIASGSCPASGYPLTKYAYDGYLRPVGVSVTESASLPPYQLAVTNFQSATATVLAYMWSGKYVSKTHAPATSPVTTPPSSDDVVVGYTYFDGGGRPLQTRTRIGSGYNADSSAHVSVGLNSNTYLVGAAVFDAAGRPTWSLDPYYSTGTAFEDVSSAPPSTGSLHGRAVLYDSRSRPTCSIALPLNGTYPVISSCASSSSSGAIATSMSYGSGSPPGQTRTFLSVSSISDSQSGASPVGQNTSYMDASGATMYSVDAENNVLKISHDPLGRVLSTSRVATGGASIGASTVYDLKGRAIRTVDDSGGTKVYTYDATGQLSAIGEAPTVDEPSGLAGVRLGYGSFGRVVDKTPFSVTRQSGACTTSWGPSSTATVGTHFTYDVPYGVPANVALPGTNFVVGRLASAANGVSTIALSYDAFGHVTQRAESFTGWQSAAWNTTNRTYRNDGGVTTTTVGSPALAAAVTYSTWYDSLGRPVEVEDGSANVLWSTSQGSGVNPAYVGAQQPAYDALGRLGAVGAGTSQSSAGYWFDNGKGAAHISFDALSNQVNAYDSGVTAGGATTPMISATRMKYQGSKLLSYQDSVASSSYLFSYDVSDRLQTAAATAIAQSAGSDPFVHQTFNEKDSFALTSGGSLWNIQSVQNITANTTANMSYGNAPGAPSLDQLGSVSGAATSQSVTYEPALDGTKTAGRGLVSSSTDTTGVVWNFQYDEEMRLTSIASGSSVSETITYGPMGELSERQFGSTGVVQYRSQDLVVSVSGVSGPATSSVNVLLSGVRVATISPASIMYYHRDRLGSVIGTSLAGGTAGAKYRYTIYGEQDHVSNVVTTGPGLTNASELGYTGALMLSGGVVYLKARSYLPRLRRFLQGDNVDINRYTYVVGDPVNYTDPAGHFASSWSHPTVCIDGVCDRSDLGVGGGAFGPGGAFVGDNWDDYSNTNDLGNYELKTSFSVSATIVAETWTGKRLAFEGQVFNTVGDVPGCEDGKCGDVTGSVSAPEVDIQVNMSGQQESGGKWGPPELDSPWFPEPAGPGSSIPGAPRSFPTSLARPGAPCSYCGRTTTTEPGPLKYNMDHNTAESAGGDGTLGNLRDSCSWCNQVEKREMDSETYQMLKLFEWLAKGASFVVPVFMIGGTLGAPAQFGTQNNRQPIQL